MQIGWFFARPREFADARLSVKDPAGWSRIFIYSRFFDCPV
jgi:hypothetical protein